VPLPLPLRAWFYRRLDPIEPTAAQQHCWLWPAETDIVITSVTLGGHGRAAPHAPDAEIRLIVKPDTIVGLAGGSLPLRHRTRPLSSTRHRFLRPRPSAVQCAIHEAAALTLALVPTRERRSSVAVTARTVETPPTRPSRQIARLSARSPSTPVGPCRRHGADRRLPVGVGVARRADGRPGTLLRPPAHRLT
jgi:hypothetical protein